MIDFLKKIWKTLNNAPIGLLILIYTVTILSCGGSLAMVFIGETDGFLAYLSYVLYALAAVSLTCAVITVKNAVPRIKNGVITAFNKTEFTKNILENYGFRTVVFTIGSFVVSVFYSATHVVMSVMEKSVWFGVLAFYYIALAFMRGRVLNYQKNKRFKQGYEKRYNELKTFKSTGITLIIVNVALAVAVAQMVLINRHFEYAGLMIYVIATYTFIKITMSIINLVKSNKQQDMTVQAIRNINLADSAVSLLALQTALFSAFGISEQSTVLIPIMNGITGGAVCLFIIFIGVYMIKKANKKLQEMNLEIDYEK